jgi:hypothetical protein
MNKDRPVETGFGDGVKLGEGKWRYIDGQWYRIDEAPAVKITKSDAVNLEMTSLSCTRSQVPEFRKEFGPLGITFLDNGKAIAKDTQAQDAYARARGCFNRNSNRSPRNF